jgi:hypothetical protein
LVDETRKFGRYRMFRKRVFCKRAFRKRAFRKRAFRKRVCEASRDSGMANRVTDGPSKR